MRIVLALLLGCAVAVATMSSARAEERPQSSLPEGVTDSALLNSRFIIRGSRSLRRQTLRWATRQRRADMVAPLIYGLRHLDPEERVEVVEALRRITGKRFGDDWFRWMQWQQENPQIRPFDGFELFLAMVLSNIDPRYTDFIYPGVRSEIRLEEVVWGGVAARDGIPPLEQPAFIAADQADYLGDDEWVFGVRINGDARAYPYRIMDWHEMANDVVGGVPVSLAYCTLCGSGILFDGRVEGRETPFDFGSSGLLYRSNKLMFDRETNSLWNQFTGRPVIGTLEGSGIELTALPLVTTTWKDWREANPDTRVLALETGFDRDYRPGRPYGNYFRSPRLMFPVAEGDRALAVKDEVFALRISGAEKAWPLSAFRGRRVIHDRVGVISLVLIGDEASRTVRAYRTRGQEFESGEDLSTLRHRGARWEVREDAIVGPNDERLSRLPGHIAYWFAFDNYLGERPLFESE